MYIVGEGILSPVDFVLKVNDLLDEKWLVRDNKKIEYYNVPAGFDIEVTSFYQNGVIAPENKRAIMYVWQFGIYNYVTMGRTWEEFFALLDILRKVLHLNNERRLVVYVHNLPYEFQFMRKHLEWQEVFILEKRKMVYALSNGIEFKCSYKLSNKSLENVAKDLQKYKVNKLVGNLDYNIIRTPLTALSKKEIKYCENDIRVILCYIQEKIEQDGDITRIPLTNTGYVRNYCRKECFSRWKSYRRIMENLTMTSEEYSQLKRTFQGGFTHANAHYVGKILYNVGSHDFGSSYPAVMVLEKFPMSTAKLITDGINSSELLELLLTHCCMFDIEFFDLMPKLYQEHPISRYKCWICENAIVDNGRIVMASHIGTTITEQDFFTYQEFYTWEHMEIKNLRVYDKQYLPKSFVKAILGLYEKKTILKDIEGEEVNYMISKNMLNAGYGMSVTDPLRDEIKYVNGEYFSISKNIEEGIDKYNKGIRRFLYYPWGVWVTAYARANLFSGIVSMGNDYVYADTDSIKSLNTEKHNEYFNNYNQGIIKKIERSAEYHNISANLYAPYNKKGKQKIIGVWDDEGTYAKFKTIGAKRYMYAKEETQVFEDNGVSVQLTKLNHTITLAGSHKEKTMIYLRKSLNAFENFDNNLVIPPDSSGRLVLTYIDDETEGDVVDVNGVSYHYKEFSSIHSESSEYNLSLSEEFIKYLKEIEDYGE